VRRAGEVRSYRCTQPGAIVTAEFTGSEVGAGGRSGNRGPTPRSAIPFINMEPRPRWEGTSLLRSLGLGFRSRDTERYCRTLQLNRSRWGLTRKGWGASPNKWSSIMMRKIAIGLTAAAIITAGSTLSASAIYGGGGGESAIHGGSRGDGAAC
jgi:hypothetical protein